MQTAINCVKILITYNSYFSPFHNHPTLRNCPCHTLPTGYKTKFYPLRISTIEEALIKGNILVHDDIYHVQLKLKADDLDELAIPSYNDQLTNTNICGAQVMCKKDVTPWTHREVFQLGFGMFHLTMNLIWALLHVHCGTINEHGSLTHLFTVLEKAQLGGKHPDFHTLLVALTQVLDGQVLNAWQTECRFPDLNAFANSKPTPERLLELAHSIIRKYATPMEGLPPISKKTLHLQPEPESSSDLDDGELSMPDVQEGDDDIVHENMMRLTQNLLYVAELVHAISEGDFRCVEDILPDLACIFRGAGSNNYATEILHFLFNIKEVWTPEFACTIPTLCATLLSC